MSESMEKEEDSSFIESKENQPENEENISDEPQKSTEDSFEEEEEYQMESEESEEEKVSKKSKRKNEEWSDEDEYFEEKKNRRSGRNVREEEPQKVTSRQAKMKENKVKPPSKKIKSAISLDNLIFDEPSNGSHEEKSDGKVSSKGNGGEKGKKSIRIAKEKDEENIEDESENEGRYSGSDEEMGKKEEEIVEEEIEEEPVDLDDEEKETREESMKTVRSSCDFAMVAHFLDIFRPLLHLDSKSKNRFLEDSGKYSIDKLEDAIITCRSRKNSPEDSKEFLASIHVKLMTSFVVAKKPPITIENWDKSLKNLFKRELIANNCPLEENPLEKTDVAPHVWGGRPTINYWTLPAATKCLILRILCEWCLDYCEKIQTWIKSLEDIEIDGRIREKSGGKDSKGWCYWTLDVNDETPRFYREKPPNKGETVGEWETVSTTMEELNEFRNSLAESTETADKNLVEFLDNEILPALVKQEKKKEESIKKMRKMEQFGLSTRNIMYEGRLRRSVRQNPNYTEGRDIDEDDDE